MEVIVGNSKEGIKISPWLLSKSSEFLKTALKKEWKEGQERVIPLPEEKQDIFDIYLQWLYSNKIFLPSHACSGDRRYNVLAHLYVLGERLIDDTFQDTVMNAVIAALRERQPDGVHYDPSIYAIWTVYEGTPENSPIRRLLVDLALERRGAPQVAAINPRFLSSEFLKDFCIGLLKDREKGKRRRGRPKRGTTRREILASGSPCAYHKHKPGELCRVTKH